MAESPIPIKEIDIQGPVDKVTKTYAGALLVLSVVLNLVLAFFVIKMANRDSSNYTETQYKQIEKERNSYKTNYDNLLATYSDFKLNFWERVDSTASVRAKEKIQDFFLIREGKNTIIIKPEK